MSSWRDQILREFTPQVARLTLVADPDGLLLEEGVLKGIRERGFELIPFEDHVAFRYAYESKYRAHWDRGEFTDLVVVLRAPTSNLDSLPYDLLQAGRRLSFSLGDLFPKLSYPVLDALDRSDLDALHEAQVRHNPETLGDNATKDFVLHHVFEVVPELIKSSSDLLRVLLRRHYRGRRLPALLDDYLIQVIRRSGRFDDWPLESIVPDRLAFFRFLQERWPIYLERLAARDEPKIGDERKPYRFEFAGPSDIPFDHDDVRIYVDDLFLEGLLRPVAHRDSQSLARTWAAAGLVTSPGADHARRMEGLLDSVEKSLPGQDAGHQDWLAFARKWAELTALRFQPSVSPSPGLVERVAQFVSKMDATFSKWVIERYHTLHNQPPIPPVMVHHIPSALARQTAKNKERVALVLIDGLPLDQWVVLRDVLLGQCHDIRFREEAVFAWVPTITAVSRQAAFSGKLPLYFPKTIQTTDREGLLWTQFWSEHGVPSAQVVYKRSFDEQSLKETEETLGHSKARVAGLVIDTVDRIMHGMELGSAGMHNQVRQWAEQGLVARTVAVLSKHGFSVYLTSDHGNIEAKGCGRPSEGAIAEERGQRARVYADTLLRARVKGDFPDAIEWPTCGLPEGFHALLAPGRSAFIPVGHKTVAHGGVSIEELIVPLISVEWRGA